MRRVRTFGWIASVWGLVCWPAWAQQMPAATSKPNPGPTPPMSPKLIDFFSAKTPYEFWLTCVILAAGLLFTFLAIWFLRGIRQKELEHATRAMTILFVIMATMVLITAGYNNEQIAPAFGLFGTIVGYILGRGEKAAAGAEQGTNGNGNGDGPPPPPPPVPMPAAGGLPPAPSTAARKASTPKPPNASDEAT
jgi:hypothetical protein